MEESYSCSTDMWTDRVIGSGRRLDGGKTGETRSRDVRKNEADSSTDREVEQNKTNGL